MTMLGLPEEDEDLDMLRRVGAIHHSRPASCATPGSKAWTMCSDAPLTGVKGTPAPNRYFGDGGRIHSADGGRSLKCFA